VHGSSELSRLVSSDKAVSAGEGVLSIETFGR